MVSDNFFAKIFRVFPWTPFLIKIYPLGRLTNSILQR